MTIQDPNLGITNSTLDDEFLVDSLRYDSTLQEVYKLPIGAKSEPASIDLEERARLALNHLSRNLDAAREHLPYFWTHLTKNPPEARHEAYDFGDVTARYVDAMILSRQMTGSTIGEEQEVLLKRLMLSLFGNDGLSYRKSTPFSSPDAVMFDQSSVLIGLVTWLQEGSHPDIKDYLDRHVNQLWHIADKTKDLCRFPINTYTKTAGFSAGSGGMVDQDAPYFTAGRFVFPLARYLEIGGTGKAEALAVGITKWITQESKVFDIDFSFTDHMHSHTSTIIGVLKLGVVLNDDSLIAWGKSAFDWVQNSSGSSTFGWYIEDIWQNWKVGADCETCSVVDMLEMAVILSENGYPEYWDTVEKITRNHLVESQLTDIGWIEWTKKLADNSVSSFENVAIRVLGGFAGWSGPNDFVANNLVRRGNLMNCCSGAGPRGLYIAWEHAVSYVKETGVTVNLAINRSASFAEVRVSEPFEGKIEILMRVRADLWVRIPGWVQREKIVVRQNEQSVSFEQKGRFILIRDIGQGIKLDITYPISEIGSHETIGGRDYEVTWRGNTVVAINPEGKNHPLYQRAYMRSKKTPERYALFHQPNNEIRYW